MTKQDFLFSLQKRLSKYISRAEINERLSFYDEMINDLIEEGLSEDEAVSKIGSVDDVVSQILTDLPSDKIKHNDTKKRHKSLKIVILAICSPLLISLLVVVLSLYISMWAVVASLWCVLFSFGVGSASGIIYSVCLFSTGNGISGAVIIASALILCGLAIFAFYGCKILTRCAIILTKKMIAYIKGFFVDKERKI